MSVHQNFKTDLTVQPDLQVHHRGTGQRRVQKPVYKDYLPPCNHACPAGENIQAWLSLAQSGKFKEAWEKLTEENPMPAIHGRVCYHPCETSCNRVEIDTQVNIHAIERFLGDKAIEEGWAFSKPSRQSGKNILIIGGGPSGLSAAYHLAKRGHAVTIFEAGPMPGGMMHFGIPAYRLPRNIIRAEINRILDLGIDLRLDYKVNDVLFEKSKGSFDAVFIAIGAHLAKKTDIPTREVGKIVDAVSFIRDVELGLKPKIGRKVAVYGGGNTAMDAARIAQRLGADQTMIIYRRDRDHMPAHDFEADEALSEGVKIHWLHTIKNMDETGITVEEMELIGGTLTATGRIESLEADTLILALGQDTDTGFLKKIDEIKFKEDGTVVVDDHMMTGYPGIFAGGDMVPSERTVTIATGHGKKAAKNIDAWLSDSTYTKPLSHLPVTADMLQVWFKTRAPLATQSHIEPAQASHNFDEIVAGLSSTQARYEAQRCLSCGNCFECDGCFAACPEDAIIKLGPGRRYKFDYTLCTGCAVCVEQCPCHAIDLIPEQNTLLQ